MSHDRTTRATHALHHEQDFRNAVAKIHDAVTKAVTSNKKYDKVAVLALRWDNDDLGLEPIIRELLDLFQDKYQFDTDQLAIPSRSLRDATVAVIAKVQSFTSNYNSPTCLLVTVYEGHSEVRNGLLQLYGANIPNVVSLDWQFISTLLSSSNSDVWIVMDSCYSTVAAMSGDEHEYLVAFGFESPASATLSNSFTRRLIDYLNNHSSKEVTIAQIHASLVKRANQSGSGMDYTPVHIASKTKPSITIRPLRRIPREICQLQTRDQLADGKVLVSVLLQGKTSIPDVENWIAWLAREIPDDVASVKVEAAFQSNSTLCLATMPIAVWDMLEKDEAYQFVGFVDSNNLLVYPPHPASPAGAGRGLSLAPSPNVQLPYRDKE